MHPRIVLLDTSFVVALENKDDPHHVRAKTLDHELLKENVELVLHWGILLEIADGYARISRRARGQQLVAKFKGEQGYRLRPITDLFLQEAIKLYLARADKDWGLTDCVSFVLMQSEKITEALTADIHFRQAGFKALLLESP